MSSAAAIRARGVVKRFEQGRVTALAQVDLDVSRGEWVAICGPSGCGKTTLLNLIAAIDSPDGGEMHVCGRDLAQLRDGEADTFRRDVVGMVFQLHNLLPRLTALENVQTPLLATGAPTVDRVRRATDLLRRVGLEDRMHARPPTLSGGERQRVAICRALVNRPAVLLADEPTGALDSRSGDQFFELLAQLRAEQDLTLVVVTHDLHVAARAQRVVRMLDGKILEPAASAGANA
jgi:putative ABC transport system ATP-binding protein